MPAAIVKSTLRDFQAMSAATAPAHRRGFSREKGACWPKTKLGRTRAERAEAGTNRSTRSTRGLTLPRPNNQRKENRMRNEPTPIPRMIAHSISGSGRIFC